MSTEGTPQEDRLRLQYPPAVHALSMREKSTLTFRSVEKGTPSHTQKLAAQSESGFPSSRPFCEGKHSLGRRWIPGAKMIGSTLATQNARVVEVNEADSAKDVHLPRTPTRFPLREKFSLDQLTSMIIPYSICPLLPNFPFASSPTVFYPGLEAFLFGSEGVPDVHVGLSSAKQDEHSDTASAVDDHPLARPLCEAPSFEPVPRESEGQNQATPNETRQNGYTSKVVRRRGRRSFSDAREAIGDRNEESPVDRFPGERGPLLSTTGGKEYEELQQRVQRESNSDGCKLSRSASDSTTLKGWVSDQLSCDDAGNRVQHRPLDTAEKLCNAEATKTDAGSARTRKMMTLDQMKSAAATLSLDRRLLFFLLLALPWALTLAFYIYVPRRLRRQLQWLFPNVLVLGVFLVTLATCLQWRLSILVDLMVLMIQLCSWSLLAFLGSVSGGRSDITSGQYAGKCELGIAGSPTEYLKSPDGQCDRRGRSTAPAVDSSEHVSMTEKDEKGVSAVLTSAEQTSSTTVLCASLLPQEDDSFSQPVNNALAASEIQGELPKLGKDPSSTLSVATGVRPAGKTWEGEAADGNALSQAGVTDDRAQPNGPSRRTGEALAGRRTRGLFQMLPISTAADVQPAELREVEKGQEVQTGKAVAGEEKGTLHIRAGRKSFQDMEACDRQQELKESEETLQPRQQLLETSGWLAATPETEITQSVDTRGLSNTSPRDGEAGTISVLDPFTVGGQQEVKACTSSLEESQRSESSLITTEGTRAQPSLLLEEALKGAPFRFADVAPADAASSARSAVSNEEREQREEFKAFPENLEKGEAGVKGRTLLLSSDVKRSSELLPVGERRAGAAATAAGTEQADVTAHVNDIVGAVAGQCESAAVSPADVLLFSEKGPLLRRRIEENNTDKGLSTAAFINGRVVTSGEANYHSSATGTPEERKETTGVMGEGERSVNPSKSQQEEQPGVYTLFQQERRVNGFFTRNLLPPFFGCSKQLATVEKQREEHRDGRGAGYVEEEMEIPSAGARTTRAAAEAEEELSMGLDRQQEEDIDAGLCAWLSFIEEQNFSHPLQASQYPESVATAAEGDRHRTVTASSSNFGEGDADCDLPSAEMFSYGLSKDGFFSSVKEQPSQYAAGGSRDLLLREEYRTQQLPALQQSQGIDWSVNPARHSNGVASDQNMWQIDSHSFTNLDSGIIRRGDQQQGYTLLMQQEMKKKAGEKKALWLLPQLDVVATSPKEVCTLHVSNSVIHRHTPEKQQQEELLRSHQTLLQSHPQQQVDFCLLSGFARSPLIGTDNEMMWRTNTSSNVCLERRRGVQNLSGCLEDIPDGQAPGETARCLRTAATFRDVLDVANAFATEEGRGAVDVSSTVMPGVPEAPREYARHQSVAAAPVCDTHTEYWTKTARAAAPASFATYVAAQAPKTARTAAAVPAPLLFATSAAAGSFVPSAAATKNSFSMCEEAAAQTERRGGERAAKLLPVMRSDLHAEATTMPPMKREPALDRAALLTASPGLLSPVRRRLAENIQTPVGGGSQCRNSLPFLPKLHAAVEGERHPDGDEKTETTSARRPPPATADNTSVVAPTAAGAARNRGDRIAHAVKAGGSIGRNSVAQRPHSAEARMMMQHYMALVKECYRSRDSQGALQVLELLQKQNRVQPDTQLLNYILLVCVAAGSKDMTERLFNLMEESGCADLVTYNTVLKSCVEAGDLVSAEKLLQRMQRNANISPDGVTFNLMVNACVVCRRPDKAWEYIDKIKAARLTPDKFTISSIIKSVQPGQNRQYIARSLKLMEGVNVCEDLLLLSTCLDACARLREYNHLKVLLQSFEKSSLRLNAHAYGTVIKAYGRLGDMQRVWTLWQQQLDEGVTPTSYTYGCMLDCLLTNNQVTAALEMFQEMIHAGVADAMHLSVVVKGLSRHRAEGARWAIAAYEMLKRSQTECISTRSASSRQTDREEGGNRSSVVITPPHRESTQSGAVDCTGGDMRSLLRGDLSHLLLNASEKKKKREGDEEGKETEIQSKKVSSAGCPAAGMTPSTPRINCYLQALNTISYNALLHLCVSTGYLKKALQLFQDMQQHPRAAPDLITYSSIIKGLCCSSVFRGLEMALELFHDMQQRAHIKADAIIYNTLIQGAATRKRVHLVELLLQHMIDHGVPPSSYTLCQCIKLHGKCNNLARVLELHRELPSRFHFEVDEYVHTALIAACTQNGAPLLAARFALAAGAAQHPLATSLLKQVLLDVQHRRQDAVGETEDMQAGSATAEQVISELEQLLLERQAEEHQQKQQQKQQQQQGSRQALEEQQRRGGMKQDTVISDADGRQRVACKSSGSSDLTVNDMSTRGSGGLASPQQAQQGQQRLQQPRANDRQLHPQVQRPAPRLQPHHDRRPQRSEGGKQQYHNNAKRMLTGSRRNNKDQPHEQQPQRRGREEMRGTEREKSALMKEMESAAGRRPGGAAAFQYTTETTVPATVDSTGSRVLVIQEKINIKFKCAGRRPLGGSSGVAAGQRKGPLHANTTAETCAQTQHRHHHQTATSKPVHRERRYYH